MNGDKAREMFSEYREGTLSASLTASLEQAMASDSHLASDYREFESLLKEFESSQDFEYEVPFDLHDRIMAKVDKSVFETKRNARPSWISGWRLALVGGVACLTVLGVLYTVKGPSDGPSTAGVALSNSTKGLEIVAIGNEIRLTHGPARTVIVVKDDLTGDLAKRFDLEGKSLNSPLSNDRPHAVLLSIQSDTESSLLAVPGSERTTELTGKGTIKDLARAIADTSGQAVRVEVKDPMQQVAWSIDVNELPRSKAVDGSFSVEQRNGLVYLTD